MPLFCFQYIYTPVNVNIYDIPKLAALAIPQAFNQQNIQQRFEKSSICLFITISSQMKISFTTLGLVVIYLTLMDCSKWKSDNFKFFQSYLEELIKINLIQKLGSESLPVTQARKKKQRY